MRIRTSTPADGCPASPSPSLSPTNGTSIIHICQWQFNFHMNEVKDPIKPHTFSLCDIFCYHRTATDGQLLKWGKRKIFRFWFPASRNENHITYSTSNIHVYFIWYIYVHQWTCNYQAKKKKKKRERWINECFCERRWKW